MRLQTILAFDVDGRVIDALDIYDGGQRGCSTPRLIKKQFQARADVARVRRITTRTIEDDR